MTQPVLMPEDMSLLSKTIKKLNKLVDKSDDEATIFLDEVSIRSSDGRLFGWLRDPDAHGYYFEYATEAEIEKDERTIKEQIYV